MTFVAWIGAVAIVVWFVMLLTDAKRGLVELLRGRGGRVTTVENDIKVIMTDELHVHGDPTAPDDAPMYPVIQALKRSRK